MTIEVYFADGVLEEVRRIRYSDLRITVQKKAEALILHAYGLKVTQIAELVGVNATTICNYLNEFDRTGLDGLENPPEAPRKSGVVPHREVIEAEFKNKPPASVAEAAKRIEELTGVRRGKTQIRLFLKELGMGYRKTAVVPAKADIAEQEEFKKKTLEPLLHEARAGERRIFFMDAAHFVYGAFQGYLWSFERVFVKTGSGRQRFNVLGAYDPIERQLVTVENTSIVDSNVICKMLHKLRYKCGPGRISVVLDNARYQRCELVQTRARRLGIELVFLPSYSPNLNLIERYWKYVKKKCLNSTYHADFGTFRSAIESCLRKANLDTEVRAELASLLTTNFQTFKQSQLQAA